MPRMISTHAVVDVERFLKGKEDRAEAIGSAGGSNVTDHVAVDGSNNVAMTADFDDPATFQAMLASPPREVALMEEHGVVLPITAYIEA